VEGALAARMAAMAAVELGDQCLDPLRHGAGIRAEQGLDRGQVLPAQGFEAVAIVVRFAIPRRGQQRLQGIGGLAHGRDHHHQRAHPETSQ